MNAPALQQVTRVCDVAVLRATRRGDHHSISDLLVDVELHVETGAAPVDAAAVLRAIHALAPEFAAGEPEAYAMAIAKYCRQRLTAIAAVQVDVRTRLWSRLALAGRPRGADFTGPSGEERVARCDADAAGERVSAGIRGLMLLSAAEHADDAVVLVRLGAYWRYGWPDVPYATQWQQVRRALSEAYAERGGLRGSELARGLAQAILDEAPPVSAIDLTVEESHREPLDLSVFGMENTGAVFGGAAAARTVHVARLRRTELS